MSKFKSIFDATKGTSEVEPAEGTEPAETEVEAVEPLVTEAGEAVTQIKPEPEPLKAKTEKDSQQPIKNSTPLEPIKVVENVEPKKMGRPKGKRSDPDFEQVTAYIKSATYTNVRIELLKEGQRREFSELVQHLLDDWIQSRE
jgi:hypothetical protein